MPTPKSYKVEKVSTDELAKRAMDVCKEMLGIICERTSKDGDEDGRRLVMDSSAVVNTTSCELHYFGKNQQLKISKVADSLYSSLKDVLRYVMDETTKRSDGMYKFQIPKHTSYIGSIIKVDSRQIVDRRALLSR